MKIVKLLKRNFKSIRYMFEQSYQSDKLLNPLLLVNMINDAIIPFIAIIFPRYIIDEITIGKDLRTAITWVIMFVLVDLVLKSTNTIIDGIVNSKKEKLIQQQYKVFSEKTMGMDLEDIENSEISDKKAQAQKVITWNSRNIDGIKNSLAGIVSFSIQIIGFSYMLSKLNSIIIIFLIGIIIINTMLNNYSQKIIRTIDRELTPINREWNYLSKITEDYSFGKLIRIYNFAPTIIRKCIENRKIFKEKQEEIHRNNLRKSIVLGFLSIIQEGIIYIYLISLTFSGNISIGELYMYLTATMAFSNAVNNLISFTIGLNYTSKYVNDFIEFINIPDSIDKSGKLPIGNNKFEFEFKNVYFEYPFSNKTVLENINIKFNINDRITIVGDNGAGKTTFVKLIMRFYEPTSGEILLNGTNIKEYEYNEYFRMFSTVFQDYQFFAFTIAENIAFEDAMDKDKRQEILKALDRVGMLEKIDSLPNNIDTYIGKGFEEEGLEMSGGEMQKIAIARSIYKDAPFFIMDEPTANLSPIAEHNILRDFHDATLNKNAIFTSHRLSSAAFSNRILVFDRGQIIEDGSHQELIKTDSLYRKMFDMQSVYYLSEQVIRNE